MLEFSVTNQTIRRTDSFEPYAGSRNYLTAEFVFSDEWKDNITAIFSHDNIHYHQSVVDGKCVVPWEVIRTPGFTVSLFCGDLVTANKVRVEVLESGFTAEGEVPGTPTPTVWEGYINTLVQKNQTIADKLESDVEEKISQSVKAYTDTQTASALASAKEYAAGLVEAEKIRYMEESEYASAVFTSPTLVAVFPDGTLETTE